MLFGAMAGWAQAPINDYFTNSTAIFGPNGSQTGDTTLATLEAGEPTFFIGSNSVWYTWTAPVSGSVVMDTIGSDFDTTLGAYIGDSVGTLAVVRENDDISPGTLESRIIFQAIAGQAYRIQINGFDDFSFGVYTLNWNMPGIVITNPPPASGELQFSLPNYYVNENVPGYATVTVIYGASAATNVTVDYATSDGSALAGVDYISVSGTLTFGPGETNKTFDVPILDNSATSSNKVFGLTLSNPIGATLGSGSSATVTIVDDETIPFVSTAGQFNFSSTFYQVTEDETSPGPFANFILPDLSLDPRNVRGGLITVTRTQGSTGRVLVDYATDETPNGSANQARPNVDYVPTSGTLIFDDYQMSTNFVIRVLNGGTGILDKIVPIVLSNPRPDPRENPALIIPTLGSRTNATLAIAEINNDIAGFSFERSVFRVDEEATTVAIDVLLPGGGPATIRLRSINLFGFTLQAGSDYSDAFAVTYPNTAYTDGTADIINPQDYLPIDTIPPLTFAANETRKRVFITIQNDNMVEFDEDIFLELREPHPNPSEGGPYHLGPNPTATVTILYDDQPAGAADRDWNPPNVSFTIPPFNATPGANGPVYAVAVQPDQKTLIGGDFTGYNAEFRNRIARINVDGSLDLSFNPGTGADGFVTDIGLYPATVANTNNIGKIVVVGAFTSFNGVARYCVARLNTDGSLDTTFNPADGANGVIRSVVVLSTGKILIGGEFTLINGVERNGIARLNDNGSLDVSFDPGSGVDGPVWALQVDNSATAIQIAQAQFGVGPLEYRTNIDTGARSGVVTVNFAPACVPDDLRVYYGNTLIFDSGLTNEYRNDLNCSFANYTGPITYVIPYGPGSASNITIVVNEGNGDPGTVWSFDATIENSVAGQRVLVGGEFEKFNGYERKGIARLLANGAVDTTFDPGGGADGPVYTIGSQNDFKVLIGGAFHDVDYRSRNGIARLNADGSLDTTYEIGRGMDDSVYTIKLDPRSGKAVVGGIFSSVDSVRRMGLARLMTNGVLDTSFMDTAYNQFAGMCRKYNFDPPNPINALSFQTDGNIMIGGSFTNLGGNAHSQVAHAGFTRVWTRQDKVSHYNVARIIGGYTLGPGSATFTYPTYSVDEFAPTLSVTLSRVDGRLGTLSADATTADRLAQAGSDYVQAKTTMTWPEFPFIAPRGVGAVGNIFFRIPILNDILIEGDEIFDMLLSNQAGSITLGGEFIPLGGTRGHFNAPVELRDDDVNHGTFAFSSPTYTVNENSGNAVVTIVRTNGSVGNVSVQFYTQNGTAVAGQDYTTVTQTVTFASGVTNKVINIPILNDTAVEFDETITLVLTNANGGATLPGGTPTDSTYATVTIVDDDFAQGRLNFSSATYVTNENATYLRVQVTRTGGNLGAISVQFAADNGTAINGVDFVGMTNTLTWPSGDATAKTIQVALLQDFVVDGNKTINLRLANPSVASAIGNRGTAVATILDSDAYGQLAFNQQFYFTSENGTNVNITVVRTNGIAGRVAVDFAITGGTATYGEDYLALTNGTLVFNPGQISANIVITNINDALVEGDESIFFSLFNASNAVVGPLSSAVLTIVDDESSNVPAGSLDTAFESAVGANNPIYALALQPDRNLIVGGDFTRFNNVTRNRLARLLPDGSLDSTFNVGQGPNRPLRSLALQPDGKLLIGGFFTIVHGTNRNHIARLNKDGSLDQFFNPGAGPDNPVYSVMLMNDGRVVIGGSFSTINNIARPGVAILNTNGTLYAGFNPGLGANGTVYSVAVQQDGKILIGGDFTTVANVPRNGVARFNTDGSLDTSFDPGTGAVGGPVRAVTLQPDGKVLIGGSFTTVNGTARGFMARLNQDGTLDSGFLSAVPGANASVFGITMQSDGKIVVGGDFTLFNGVTRGHITRLNPNGKTDPTINFGSGANAFVNAIAIQPDRKIIIGGGFTQVGEQDRRYVARLHGGSLAGSGGVEFASAFYSATENQKQAVIRVRRVGGTSGDITVGFATTNVTATPNLDYTNVIGTLTFVEGEVLRTFIIPIVDDKEIEDPETVDLGLFNPTGGAVLGPDPFATLTIISDDSQVSFLANSYNVNENAVSGSASIAVIRTGATNTSVTVDYRTTGGGTATAGVDYIAVNDALTFAPGETIKFFPIQILNDTNVEGVETVNLFLTNVTANAILGQSTATLSIIDDDLAPGILNFSSAVYSVNEYETNITITVLRTNGSSGVVTVNFFTSDGTASAGEDYGPTAGTLAFGDGETVKTFNIPIIPDYLSETNETVILSLSGANGGAILGAVSTATLTIINNNLVNGVLNFTGTNFIYSESNITARISVSRTLGFSNAVSVLVRTVDGTAKAGADYVALTNVVLTWTNEDHADKELTVTLVNDTLVEETEFLLLELYSPSGGAVIGSQPTTMLSIEDDDFGPGFLSLSSNAYVINENGTNAVITVVRTFGKTGTVSVDFATGNSGNAIPGVHYYPTNGTLVFKEGETNKTFLVPVIDNFVVEVDHTIDLSLSNPIGASLSNQITSAILTIVENEQQAGSIDASFNNTGANAQVYVISVQTNNNKLVVGGDFTTFSGLTRNHLLRLNANGGVDAGFDVGSAINNSVRAVAFQGEGKILAGGAFTANSGLSNGYLARVLVDGTVDTNFMAGVSGADNFVYAAALASDGKVVIAGVFNSVNGATRNYVARLDANGFVDPNFNPALGANNLIRTLAVLADGSVIVGGDFTAFNGVPRGHLARLTADGSLDASFLNSQVGADASVLTLAVEHGGKILVGGTFTNFNGVLKNRIARLNPDGSLDNTFDTGSGTNGGFNEFVSSIALQADGKLVVGGGYTVFNGTPANRLVRLLSNGSFDTSINFGSGANNYINTVVVQPDGKIVVGGGFTEFDGVTRNYIARLNGGQNVGAGSFILSTTNYNVLENASNVVVTIRRSIGGQTNVSVQFRTFDIAGTNSAVDGVNYIGVNTNLNFLPGETVKTVKIRIIDDLISNPDRVFGIELLNAQGGAVLGSIRTGTVTILNNDDVINFDISTYTVSEGAGQALITVQRTGGGVGTVSVNFTTSDGTALAGSDYVATNGTLTFSNGQTSLTFTVPILQDLLVEGNETIDLALTVNPNTGSAILGLSAATLTIVDDDFSAGIMGFSQANYTVSEQGTQAVITVVRVTGNSGAASVDYATIDGTALAGLDYGPASGHLVFADGEVSKTFTVPIFDDTLVEGNETVNLFLFNPSGVVLGQSSSVLTIRGDEATFNFSQANYLVNEAATNITITVTRSPDGTGPVSVDFTTSNNLAVAGLDYVATNGTLFFDIGETSKTFTVTILNDNLGEGLEDFFVVLTNALGESALGLTNVATVGIVDNDISFSFDQPNYIYNENSGTGYVNVIRTGLTNGTASVNFQTSDGTATAGQDYIFTSVNLVFLPGETNKQVGIPILQDLIGEGDETVNLNLVNPTNATVGLQPTALLTIVDDEDNLSLSTTNYFVDENATNAVIAVVRRGIPSSGQVTVSYSTSSGTATPGADYTNVSGILVFGPFDTIKTFSIPIVDDSLAEGNETVFIRLSNITGGAALSTPTNATLTIVDDDVSLRFASASYSVTENATNASISILRQGNASNTVSVLFHTTAGTATPDLDYENVTNQVVFLPGVTNRTVLIPIVDDLQIEGNETVNLFLSNPAPTNSAILGSPVAAVLTIVDNDNSILIPAGSAIVSESFIPANGVVDAGETVTINLALRNVGNVDTVNLVATLLNTNGVLPQGQSSQTYGVVNAGGDVVTRPFSFRATGVNGSAAIATLHLTDGSRDLGIVTFAYTLGSASYTFFNTAGITINDNAPASPYPSAIQVSNVFGIVTKVTVTLYNLSHSYPQDIDIMLVGPANDSVVLMSDIGGADAVNNLTLTFDDDAVNTLAPDKQLTSGTYRTTNYLAADSWPAPAPSAATLQTILAFNPTNNPNGFWRLYVVDDSPRDVGNIAGGWSLTITTSGTITPTADLSVTPSDSPDPVIVGHNITYTLNVTNHGPSTAQGVMLTNVLPTTAQFISCSGPCTNLNGTVICNLGDLASGARASVVITARAPQAPPTLPFSLIDMVYVGSSTMDVNGGNNSANIKTTVQGNPTVTATKKPGSANDLVISWPVGAETYVLEYTDILLPPNWQRYTNSQAQTSGGLKTITINSPTNGMRFFRLHDSP
ncbi:MAG: hypothetical protein JWM16_4623 [Verrucomicrobiales bacterium]|nr:hypothetical protein [Verrucomicrobiales bacterium]